MMLKRTITAALLVLLAFPLSAQERTQSHVFRFVADEDMFYIPWNGNGERLDTLLKALTANLGPLSSGNRYICVASYGARGNDTLPAARMAYLRCLRVKSELIVRGAATEAMFVTDRHIAAPFGDSLREVVVVTFPATVGQVAALAGAEAAARVEAYARELSGEAERERLAAQQASRRRAAAERAAKEQAAKERLAAQQSAREKAEADREAAGREEKGGLAAAGQAPLQADAAAKAKPYTFALRANLLRWATLTPDLGIEWRINRDWGILANGTWTSWSRDDNDRRYALWEVAPEVRWYLGKEKRGYIGAIYKVGQFNYKFSATGKQGDLTGGGITGGYQLKLGRALSLDLDLGIGCIHAGYDKYEVIDGVRVRCGNGSKNRWGPVSAGVSLVWKLF